jgi:hypothetical protein
MVPFTTAVILDMEAIMRQWEYEIVTLRPKWSPVGLLTRRSREQNTASIYHQLYDQYIAKGWQVADDIQWERDCRFAVLKVGRPAPSLFDQLFEPSSTR